MIGARLREFRDKRKLTQKELANILSVSTDTISKYEREESKPTGETIAQICKELDVSADYLLGVTDVAYPIKRLDFQLLPYFPEEAIPELISCQGYLMYKYTHDENQIAINNILPTLDSEQVDALVLFIKSLDKKR